MFFFRVNEEKDRKPAIDSKPQIRVRNPPGGKSSIFFQDRNPQGEIFYLLLGQKSTRGEIFYLLLGQKSTRGKTSIFFKDRNSPGGNLLSSSQDRIPPGGKSSIFFQDRNPTGGNLIYFSRIEIHQGEIFFLCLGQKSTRGKSSFRFLKVNNPPKRKASIFFSPEIKIFFFQNLPRRDIFYLNGNISSKINLSSIFLKKIIYFCFLRI